MSEDSKHSFNPEDIQIRPVDKKDYDECLNLFKKYFIPREQISLGLELPVEDHAIFFQDHLETWIEGKASVCAVYVPTGEIVGALVTKILTRDDKETFQNEEKFPKYNSKVQMLMKILGHIEDSFNIFEDEKVDKVLELAAITVNQNFSGRKIVYRLIEETEKLAYQLGIRLVTTQAANIVSQHVFLKAGYEAFAEVDYETLEIDGKRPLKVANMNGTTKAVVVNKYLKKD